MASLDRYLKDVRAHLPSDQAVDIVNELGENLRSEIEDREAALDRPLTDMELDGLLRAHGNPLIVAARYRNEQRSFTFGRQLIGPALFPAYLRVLTVNIAISGIVVLIAAIVASSGQPLGSTPLGLALAFVIQFGLVTGIFIAADRLVATDRWPGPFDDSKYQPGEPKGVLDRVADSLIGKEFRGPVGRRTSVTDLALGVLLFGWLIAIRPPLEFGFLRSGPGWETFVPFLVVVAGLAATQPIINLVRPELVILRGAARALTNAAMSVIFVASLRVGEWVVLRNPGGATVGERVAGVEFNRWIGVSLTIVAAMAAALVLFEIRRLLRSLRSTTGGLQSGVV